MREAAGKKSLTRLPAPIKAPKIEIMLTPAIATHPGRDRLEGDVFWLEMTCIRWLLGCFQGLLERNFEK
ncbi:MAG: hypothetical protein OHK0037_11380 [Elainellaceae cyanobacterium]